MIGQLLLGAAWLLAPHPVLEDPHQFLPLASFHQTARQVWWVSHQREDWALAFYLSPELELQQVAPFVRGIDKEHHALLGVRAPRLILREGLGWEGDVLNISSLAVDASEYLFKALLDAYFDLEIVRFDEQKRKDLEARAADLFDDLPQDQQLSAYLSAQSDFGAHLLSLANEISRSFARRSDSTGLCVLANNGGGLFKLWRIAFEGDQFRGHASNSRTSLVPSTSSSEFSFSARSLELWDKRWLIDEALEDRFVGEAGLDFARFCNDTLSP